MCYSSSNFVTSCFPINTSNFLVDTKESGIVSLFLILVNNPYLFSMKAPGPKLNLIVVIYPLKFV